MSTTNTAARAAKARPKSGTASRISGNSPAIQRVLIVGVAMLYLLASIVSFQGLLAVAPWLHVSPLFAFAIPGFIDLAIVFYKLSELILKSRGQYKAAKKAVFGTFFFTGVSAIANGLHVYTQGANGPLVELVGGIFIAVIAPWAVYLAASVLTDVVVKPKPVPSGRTAARKAPAKARATRKVSAPVAQEVALPEVTLATA
ncbi:hypothetical protein GCM10025867_48790 (plasmid) [Frondihabitans sucicola]|uniref:DUF2637 domain-containing protein n=1 Tax=Frondihabitans sucicola TaxID=1268041 RepID=A0ABM8GVY6_9MICO|nr:DUF2637 domain-containing protein [Frondihabitans sucicola]BDZ52638.1 hypothetical protein GCM10025867_48790 [Frondihabitans sucicola]